MVNEDLTLNLLNLMVKQLTAWVDEPVYSVETEEEGTGENGSGGGQVMTAELLQNNNTTVGNKKKIDFSADELEEADIFFAAEKAQKTFSYAVKTNSVLPKNEISLAERIVSDSLLVDVPVMDEQLALPIFAETITAENNDTSIRVTVKNDPLQSDNPAQKQASETETPLVGIRAQVNTEKLKKAVFVEQVVQIPNEDKVILPKQVMTQQAKVSFTKPQLDSLSASQMPVAKIGNETAPDVLFDSVITTMPLGHEETLSVAPQVTDENPIIIQSVEASSVTAESATDKALTAAETAIAAMIDVPSMVETAIAPSVLPLETLVTEKPLMAETKETLSDPKAIAVVYQWPENVKNIVAPEQAVKDVPAAPSHQNVVIPQSEAALAIAITAESLPGNFMGDGGTGVSLVSREVSPIKQNEVIFNQADMFLKNQIADAVECIHDMKPANVNMYEKAVSGLTDTYLLQTAPQYKLSFN